MQEWVDPQDDEESIRGYRAEIPAIDRARLTRRTRGDEMSGREAENRGQTKRRRTRTSGGVDEGSV